LNTSLLKTKFTYIFDEDRKGVEFLAQNLKKNGRKKKKERMIA